ncbi:DNA repair protein RecN, partial [bacterium]|nr:DNA repair protein RecN [bacterium]
MLKNLNIKNYALIGELAIEFGPGLNILTGETGAGKSIIVDALGLLLGDRAKPDVIRSGESLAVVEGFFEIPGGLGERLSRFEDLDLDSGLLLRREVHANGRTRCFLNDSPVSLSVFSDLGDNLVDLHGQHDHQALLRPERHLDTIDSYGVDAHLIRQVSESHKSLKALERELESLLARQKNLSERRDLLAFRVREFDLVHPAPGEEEDLIHEEKRMNSREKLLNTAQMLSESLYEGQGSAMERLHQAETSLSDLRDVDPRFPRWAEDCASMRITIQELVKGFQSLVSGLEFNPERLEEIRDRLGKFSLLKKKYGGSMAEVLKAWESARVELTQLDHADQDISGVEVNLEAERKAFTELCRMLSERRKETAALLEKALKSALSQLGFSQGLFQVRFGLRRDEKGPVRLDGESLAASHKGMDLAEFLITVNPGEEPRPLANVASGGEISRIMLALKTVLARADAVPVLVFDEIDTGISGRIARVVGINLKAVSQDHQVICITHLPQIASLGDRHFAVEKRVEGSRSFTRVRTLAGEDRVLEIAKLLGGETV